MCLPTDECPNSHRQPENCQKVFKEGDFEDFIKPICDTLDLYHNQGVDPRAIAISWKKLAENNPDANLRFASMEVKGEDNLLLRLKTSPKADKSQLSAEYFEDYNQLKIDFEVHKKVIAEKDNHIQQLADMLTMAIQIPKFYIEGKTSVSDNHSRTQNIYGGTTNASGAGAFNLGDISGTVANTIDQLPTSSNPNEPGIKDFLTQLQQAVDDPNLSDDDKKQTLEQLQRAFRTLLMKHDRLS